MSLINLSGAWLSFSDAPLLNLAELHIEPHERVCLVGRNGAGKSTLLKVINQEIILDDGQLTIAQNCIIARLQQDPPRDIKGSVFDFVAEGVQQQAELLKQYHSLSSEIAHNPSEANLNRLAKLQEQLDHQDLWRIEDRINTILNRLELKAEQQLATLSGGWLRRAALAQALVCSPDVLLLDEPTNHLDIESIEWLENFLREFTGSIVFISHDRAFIRAMATRIIDLDRGKLVSWPGDYDAYLIGKEEALRIEAVQNAEFDKKLAQEETWIRQGIKARRTRNEGRVRALQSLRKERMERREVMGKANISVETATRSGKIIFELEHVNYQFNDQNLINDFSIQVQRGDKIALIGPNGCGKTTLLKLMLGQLSPQSGRIHCGTKLAVAYFDQYRAVLEPEKTVIDNLAEGKQEVMVNGRSRHVLGYLQDFLFHPKRAMTPVKALSGGERNRLLLAKLFLQPSNLLIMDEPTNDLDIETLELLEELIEQYQGTVMLVSHDRQFVDNTVTECWIFEGNGVITNYVGGYFDAHQQRQASLAVKHRSLVKQPAVTAILPNETKEVGKKISSKLSYNFAKELEALPQKIDELEQKLAELQQQVSTTDFFAQPHEVAQQVLSELAKHEVELERLYARWEQLEALKKQK